MILISHRGNINGPEPEKENRFDHIYHALELGYEVEVDVWWYQNTLWLGHDKPQYIATQLNYFSEKFWLHCKNIEALNHIQSNVQYSPKKCKWFWHQNDDYTLTARGEYIWTYPGKPLGQYYNSIAVLPEQVPNWDISKAAGVCSDFIIKYKK